MVVKGGTLQQSERKDCALSPNVAGGFSGKAEPVKTLTSV